jgi:hypothetical protein
VSVCFKRRHFLPPSIHFDVSAGTRFNALPASIAEIELDLVVFALGQFHKAILAAIHPASFAVHAHAARHAARRFHAGLRFFETGEDFRKVPDAIGRASQTG